MTTPTLEQASRLAMKLCEPLFMEAMDHFDHHYSMDKAYHWVLEHLDLGTVKDQQSMDFAAAVAYLITDKVATLLPRQEEQRN